jgi:hypothetical protein
MLRCSFLAEVNGDHVNAKMEHLACFAGGMLGLYAKAVGSAKPDRSHKFMQVGLSVRRSLKSGSDRSCSPVAL